MSNLAEILTASAQRDGSAVAVRLGEPPSS